MPVQSGLGKLDELSEWVKRSRGIRVILGREIRAWIKTMPLCHLYYHFVWATHERLPLITPRREGLLYPFIQRKTSQLGGSVYEIGGIADHLHLIVTLPPSLAISDYVRLIKGSSSRFMNGNAVDLDAPFKWQQEYGAFSISDRNLKTAISYVQNQKQHHAEGTIFPILEPDALPPPTRS